MLLYHICETPYSASELILKYICLLVTLLSTKVLFLNRRNVLSEHFQKRGYIATY